MFAYVKEILQRKIIEITGPVTATGITAETPQLLLLNLGEV